MATAKHHPRARGYDTWLGYWHHANDYWQHTEEMCSGSAVRDLWEYNATFDGPAHWLANGADCSQKNQAPAGQRCVYEEELLTDRVIEVVGAHDTSSPMFLFWSMHLVHMPLQVPQAYLDRFSDIKNTVRHSMSAMVAYMDDEVGRVSGALRDRGMFDSSLLVFHADNGGEIMGAGICGGNNWPLSGGKFSNWEGKHASRAVATTDSLPHAPPAPTSALASAHGTRALAPPPQAESGSMRSCRVARCRRHVAVRRKQR